MYIPFRKFKNSNLSCASSKSPLSSSLFFSNKTIACLISSMSDPVAACLKFSRILFWKYLVIVSLYYRFPYLMTVVLCDRPNIIFVILYSLESNQIPFMRTKLKKKKPVFFLDFTINCCKHIFILFFTERFIDRKLYRLLSQYGKFLTTPKVSIFRNLIKIRSPHLLPIFCRLFINRSDRKEGASTEI